MRLALEQAERARRINEVPVGCIIVSENDEILSGTHNLTEFLNDPTAHAEILAIRETSKLRGTWRLENCTIYVTLEPCIMCAGAIMNSRTKKIVYGARDKKSGALESKYSIFDDNLLNHYVETENGVLETECSEILKVFFSDLRKMKKGWKALQK